MDISGFDIGALGTAVGSIVTAIKSFSNSKKAEYKAKVIAEDRAATKIKRDEEFRLMQTELAVNKKEIEHLGSRLDDGNHRFERLENKLDSVVQHQNETNNLLSQLIGKVEAQNAK